MACSSTGLSEEQLECSVCLDVFTDPVSTPCGHNFCQTCINSSWDNHQVFRCPLCKKTFDGRPELCVNTAFRDVVDQFRRSRLSGGGQFVDVLCDVCSGRKLKAVKSCLNCIVSYCEEHLEPHKRVKQLKKHQLIEPVENLEERVCEKHGRPLEMFCRTDQECVCMMCNEMDHKDHDTVTLETESEERKVCLDKMVLEVCHTIQRQEEKVKEVQQSADLSNRNAAKDIMTSSQLFNGLVHSIEESKLGLHALIKKIQTSTQSRTEEFLNEMKQGITDLQMRRTELEQLSLTEDHLRLLKSSPSTSTLPTTKDWFKIIIDRDPGLGTLRRALIQLKDTIYGEINMLLETELERLLEYAVDVTLDPETAHPSLILSEDGKQVKNGGTCQNLPDTPKRFLTNLYVLAREGFSSGRFYYEVQVSEATWVFGVASESIKRNDDDDEFNKRRILLRVHISGSHIMAAVSNNFCDMVIGIPPPQKVGVFVDYEGGQVSFYDVDNSSHIYSFTGQTFTETLYPLFGTDGDDNDKDSDNDTCFAITPVKQGSSVL